MPSVFLFLFHRILRNCEGIGMCAICIKTRRTDPTGRSANCAWLLPGPTTSPSQLACAPARALLPLTPLRPIGSFYSVVLLSCYYIEKEKKKIVCFHAFYPRQSCRVAFSTQDSETAVGFVLFIKSRVRVNRS